MGSVGFYPLIMVSPTLYRDKQDVHVQLHEREGWVSVLIQVGGALDSPKMMVLCASRFLFALHSFSGGNMDSSLLSNIQKLFYERIEVFAAVEFNKLSIVTGIIKIALKVCVFAIDW